MLLLCDSQWCKEACTIGTCIRVRLRWLREAQRRQEGVDVAGRMRELGPQSEDPLIVISSLPSSLSACIAWTSFKAIPLQYWHSSMVSSALIKILHAKQACSPQQSIDGHYRARQPCGHKRENTCSLKHDSRKFVLLKGTNLFSHCLVQNQRLRHACCCLINPDSQVPRFAHYAPCSRLLQVDDVLEVLAGRCCCCMLWLLDCAAAHKDALGPALNSSVLSGRPLAAPWNPIAAAICKQSMVRRAVALLSCGRSTLTPWQGGGHRTTLRLKGLS